jgi:TonB family protein
VVVVLVVLALIVIVGRNSGGGSTGGGNPPPQTPAIINAGWPSDSPELSPSGYIQSLNARVQELKFFAAGDTAPAKNDRVYATSFRPGEGQFIYWELNLIHPTRQARQSYAIALYLYSPDGSVKSQSQSSSYVEPDWANSFCFNKWTDQASSWTPGNYRVSFFADGVKVAAGMFTIEPRPEETQIATDPVPQETAPSVENVPPQTYEPSRQSEPPKPTVADWRRQLDENCAIERRLRNGQMLNAAEMAQLQRVRGSCEKLYGTDSLPEPRAAQPPPPSQGWRHFGDRPDTGRSAPTSNPVEEAQLIRKVPPSYPPLAKQARVQGVVRLSATIGTDGKLHNIRVVSGHAMLSGAAVAAVEQWRYTPTRLNGTPVEAETQIDVNFTLGQ